MWYDFYELMMMAISFLNLNIMFWTLFNFILLYLGNLPLTPPVGLSSVGWLVVVAGLS